MQDVLLKATIAGGIRIYILSASHLVDEACKKHGCLPLASAALGRTMMGALLLAATMKMNECITLKIKGDGILGSVVADASNAVVRGYVDNPYAELELVNGKLAVGQAIGSGQISVTRFNDYTEPFTGVCDLKSGEIAEDITEYLYVSEQTPSSVALGVLVQPDGVVSHAGGFFVQALPEAEEENLDKITFNISQLPPITTLLEAGYSLQEIVGQIAGELAVNYYEQTQLQFACQCSKEKISERLATLNKDDLRELLADAQTEVSCHFCNSKYYFTSQEIAELIREK